MVLDAPGRRRVANPSEAHFRAICIHSLTHLWCRRITNSRYSANHRWSGGGSPHLFLMPQPASVSRCRAGLTRTTSSRGEGGGRCIAKFIYLKGGNVTLVGSGFEPWELKFWECTAPKRGICCSPRNSRIRHHPSCNHRVIFSWTREAIRAYHQCGLSSNLVASRTAPHPPNPLPGYTLRRVNIEKYRVGRSSQPSKRKIDSYFITTNTVCGGHPMQPIGQHRLASGTACPNRPTVVGQPRTAAQPGGPCCR